MIKFYNIHIISIIFAIHIKKKSLQNQDGNQCNSTSANYTYISNQQPSWMDTRCQHVQNPTTTPNQI